MTSALSEDKRRALDDYPTPDWAIDAILPWVPLTGAILEPACGSGAILSRIVARGISPLTMAGIEIDPARAFEAHRTGARIANHDALEDGHNLFASSDLIITNPPFRQAEAFCRRSLTLVRPGGCVAMLLRLAFLESAQRYEFHREFPVTALHVFSSRPSFTGDGKSDSAAYAWFVWGGLASGINFIPPHKDARKITRCLPAGYPIAGADARLSTGEEP